MFRDTTDDENFKKKLHDRDLYFNYTLVSS